MSPPGWSVISFRTSMCLLFVSVVGKVVIECWEKAFKMHIRSGRTFWSCFSRVLSRHVYVKEFQQHYVLYGFILLVLFFRSTIGNVIGFVLEELGYEDVTDSLGFQILFRYGNHSGDDDDQDHSDIPDLAPAVEAENQPSSNVPLDAQAIGSTTETSNLKPEGWLVYDSVFGLVPKEVLDRWNATMKSKDVTIDSNSRKQNHRKEFPPIRSFTNDMRPSE